jgi:hypothetical protein
VTARFLIGDVFDQLATLDDGSVDLVVTSPPFLALRSYLPADHPDKHREIGSEATPAAFLDVMLRFTAELQRVVAPHGSIAIELGDTYAGSSMSGGDQQRLEAGLTRHTDGNGGNHYRGEMPGVRAKEGWPLAKSKTLIPELYRIALAYGINPLTGEPSPAGQWRIRNVVTWARPNPPVGALGDKWRPATSDVVVACVSGKRYWDDLATRKAYAEGTLQRGISTRPEGNKTNGEDRGGGWSTLGPVDLRDGHGSGAPLLDYWEIPLLDGDEERRYGPKEKPAKVNNDKRMYTDPVARNDGGEGVERYTSQHEGGSPLLDYWVIPPGGYEGSHYAVFPPELVVPLVKAMTPERVCRECGEPSRRIVERLNGLNRDSHWVGDGLNVDSYNNRAPSAPHHDPQPITTGWTDCGHNNYRPGLVCDPFAGSGTTLLVATGHGHDAIGIDLDARNAELAMQRVGPFLLEVV